jgi:UPF0755 protein
MTRLRWTALFLASLLVAGLLGWTTLQRWLDAPLRIEPPGHTIQIPRGQPLAVTARRLAEAGVLEHPQWLVTWARLTGRDQRVRAGEYLLTPGSSPRSMLEQFATGAVVQHALTIVEGWNIRDLRRALAGHAVLEQTLAGRDDATLMAELGAPDLHPEGQFFPDTYLFDRGDTDLDLLRRAHERLQKELAAAWESRVADLPLESPYQMLILASIVEKETALASERPRIAGVFIRRLRLGMRLQTDPTVIYGLGAGFDGNLRRRDLESDGPYNTYTRTGLPPTPIAAVGAEALAAVARPDERDELYFVATGLGDGSHEFSRTLAEHERAVARYLQRLRQRRMEQGK